jgi:cell division septal protein FtsQ
MRKNIGKILGTVVFILLISWILYLTFYTARKFNKGDIKMIEITGNNLLNESDYLMFTKLNDLSFNHDIPLSVIKDRFEKHPYISRADVEADGDNTDRIILSEKKMMAVILNGNEAYFITEDFQILPIFPYTKESDLPVISDMKDSSQIKPMCYVKSYDIIDAFKIISAAKKTNMNIYKRITGINLNRGGDITMNFSGINTEFIFGRGEEARKMIYLEIMWDGIIDGNTLIKDSDYIDLRFANEVYIKTAETAGLVE